MDGGLQHNKTPASSCSSERGVSLVPGATVRLLLTLCYCFLTSCLWDLGLIHCITRVTRFSEFQQTPNLQQAASGTWTCGEEEGLQLCALIWPRVKRGFARRSRSPVFPVYNSDAHTIPQCLVVPIMLAEETIKVLLVVPPVVAQVKGRRQNLLSGCCKVQVVLNNQPPPNYPRVIKTVSVTCDIPKKARADQAPAFL